MMADIQIDNMAIDGMVKEKIPAVLDLIGAFVDGKIKDNIKNNFKTKHGLLNSTGWNVSANGDEMSVRNYVNMVYAAIQELGGIIKPDSAGALTIPVHPDALKWSESGQSAKNMPGLVLIKRKGKTSFLVRIKTSRGKEKQFDIMYVLVKSAQIPARPYIRPAVYDNQDAIMEIATHGR